MKIGVSVFANERTAKPDLMFRRVEELGFDALIVPEHAIIPVKHKTPYPAGGGEIPDWYSHMPDPFVLLGIAAAVTSRIKLMTGICLVPEHNPMVLAKEVATVDYFSGGRMWFGIGAGWLADETEIMGVEFGKRWGVTRECIRAMKELWTKPEASFEGKYIKFPAVRSYPKPAQKPHPPVLIGANGGAKGPERVLRDVVEIGDGWMPLRLKPDKLAANLATLKKMCADAGRDFSQIDVTMFRPFEHDDLKRTFEEYEAAGCNRIVVGTEALYRKGVALEPATWEKELEELASRYLI
jgi:probable F420-dependent oxidoreductase